MAKSQRLSNLPNAPAFSAYGSALQSVADQTYTKIAYNTEEFDTNSCYNTSTYRFTPNVAGYYRLSATLSSASSANGAVWVVLYKNGSLFKGGTYSANANIGPYVSFDVLVYANGSTDYFEVYGWHNAGTSVNIGSGSSNITFSGYLARVA